MTEKPKLDNNLKSILEDRGIKITWLSEKSGVSRNTIHSYFSGVVPALDKAASIAKVLDLTVYEIWNLSDLPK